MNLFAPFLQENWQAFQDINARAGQHPVLDTLMVFSANDLIFLLPLLLLVFWCLCARWSPLFHQRGTSGMHGLEARARTLGQQMVLLGGLAVALALAFNLALGDLIAEPRPFVSHPGAVHLLVAHAADASFPSDQSAVASALASMLVLYVPLAAWAWLRQLKQVPRPLRMRGLQLLAASVLLALVAVGAVGMIGLARVYVGVHYPADIAGGVSCGLLAAGLLTALRPWVTSFLDRGIHLAERLHFA